MAMKDCSDDTGKDVSDMSLVRTVSAGHKADATRRSLASKLGLDNPSGAGGG
jgi:hypothetical protein